MNYRNIDDLNHCILQHLSILPRDFDLIVGVPRSGMFPANLLALYLNLPVTDIDSFRNGHIYQTGERGKTFNMNNIHNVLVVDDSIATGKAMKKCREPPEGHRTFIQHPILRHLCSPTTLPFRRLFFRNSRLSPFLPMEHNEPLHPAKNVYGH
ncbi:phosphoribosyltransferase [Bacteroides uniformis]|nr:phosphoribosyltransferase [Bacteroides uniformis]